MSSAQISLVASVFLASAVVAVEALTIVLAVVITRRWSSALLGAGVGLTFLALLTVALGPALVLVPIATLRLLVGALLLVFGLQWLRLGTCPGERDEVHRWRAAHLLWHVLEH